MNLERKKELKQKRCYRIRKKVIGSQQRPRLAVHFSHQHIYAQCIDDTAGQTLFFLSTLSQDVKEKSLKPNVHGAEELGGAFAERAQKIGISQVVFDRRGRRYHGCVKAFAEAARKNGLKF